MNSIYVAHARDSRRDLLDIHGTIGNWDFSSVIIISRGSQVDHP